MAINIKGNSTIKKRERFNCVSFSTATKYRNVWGKILEKSKILEYPVLNQEEAYLGFYASQKTPRCTPTHLAKSSEH